MTPEQRETPREETDPDPELSVRDQQDPHSGDFQNKSSSNELLLGPETCRQGFQVTSDRRSQSLERTRLDSSSCRQSVRLQGDESRHEPQQQG
ncbi:hypothetical protein JOQ06_022927 [Pogonophryne albipinna]|uniref:Uncharacterized protein n=1 Tax=Pogonophryne albipinna TaxID=1090488 RepID=A0AAD6ACZ1_9TELE|nr:hypothetical protein JOQ06_022927 [Pogonophryne albipinna]